MENKLTHKFAFYLADKMNRHWGKEGLELTKMIYGLELFLINISKLIIIYTLSAFAGVLFQTLIIQGAFGLLRRYSFGLHALNSTVCTLSSCLMFVFTPWVLYGAGIDNGVVLAVFIPLILLFYIYAPADTKARPLIGVTLRKKLKKQTTACCMLLLAITLLIPNEYIKLLLTLGAVYQCVSILPLTYKLLKRSEKNYEAYEHA